MDFGSAGQSHPSRRDGRHRRRRRCRVRGVLVMTFPLVDCASAIMVVFWPAMAVSKSQSNSVPFNPDDQQRQAVEHVHGPMLVIAGAGSGKTSVLIHRIAHLVEQGHAKPEGVLALTYTVAAAAAMRAKVRALLAQPIHSATFHDYCFDFLKRSGRGFGVL